MGGWGAHHTPYKSFSIFPPPAGMSLTKFSPGGNNLLMTSFFPPRESLVSGIPAGVGTGISNSFVYGVSSLHVGPVLVNLLLTIMLEVFYVLLLYSGIYLSDLLSSVSKLVR